MNERLKNVLNLIVSLLFIFLIIPIILLLAIHFIKRIGIIYDDIQEESEKI